MSWRDSTIIAPVSVYHRGSYAERYSRCKTTSNNPRTCDTVSAGAFFPQAQLQVPQEEMRQHRGQHVAVPAWVFAHFIMRHPQFGFRFLTTLFHGPPDATSPHEKTKRRAFGGITDVQRIGRVGAKRACDYQPHRPLGKVILA